MKDGIRRFLSCGYRCYRMQAEGDYNAQSEDPTYRVTDWEPHEISMASIPADPTATVGRASATQENDIIITRTAPATSIDEPPEGPAPVKQPPKHKEVRTMEKCLVCGADLVNGKCPMCETRAEARRLENARIKEIRTIETQFPQVPGINDMAAKYINEDKPVDEFRKAVMAAFPKVEPTPKKPEEKVKFRCFGEQLQYIAVMSDDDPGKQRARNLFGSDLTRHWMDFNRAISGMSVSVPSDGGFMVQTEFTTALLRNLWETGLLLEPMYSDSHRARC